MQLQLKSKITNKLLPSVILRKIHFSRLDFICIYKFNLLHVKILQWYQFL